jgi:hypothetical protein
MLWLGSPIHIRQARSLLWLTRYSGRSGAPPAGSWASGGFCQDKQGSQGFVADERHGRWGTAIQAPAEAPSTGQHRTCGGVRIRVTACRQSRTQIG